MITRFEGVDAAGFEQVATLNARELTSFLEQFAPADDESPIGWRDRQTFEAHAGVWLRHGMFSVKNGSFIDPSDLSAYGCQYYEPDANGRHEAFQIGFGSSAPVDAVEICTAADLRAALVSAEPLKLLAPDSAFELHGRLTPGWHIAVYQADPEVIVFE